MRATYDKALALLIADEGGYVNDPHDSGGETNYGITWRTYNAYRKRKGLSEQSVKGISMQEVHEIYRAQYANVIRYDHLPAGLDYAVFDFAVNSGTKRASKFLQAIVGQRTDGVIGVQTLQAVEDYVAQYGVEQLILRLCDNRLRFSDTAKAGGGAWQRLKPMRCAWLPVMCLLTRCVWRMGAIRNATASCRSLAPSRSRRAARALPSVW